MGRKQGYIVVDLYAIWKCCRDYTEDKIALLYTIPNSF